MKEVIKSFFIKSILLLSFSVNNETKKYFQTHNNLTG